jgi:hypothetical protein
MLYVGYEPSTKVFDPKSIQGWIDFCEEQPENATYDWVDPSECAAAKYFKESGQPHWSFTCNELRNLVGDRIYNALLETPWTYGALLKRL